MTRALVVTMVLLAACGGGTTAATTTTAAPARSALRSACGERVVVQTDWFPEPEHGALYQLAGPGGKLDKEKGIRVRPEHVHTALWELAGIAEHPLTRKFPLGVAEKERLRGLWG